MAHKMGSERVALVIAPVVPELRGNVCTRCLANVGRKVLHLDLGLYVLLGAYLAIGAAIIYAIESSEEDSHLKSDEDIAERHSIYNDFCRQLAIKSDYELISTNHSLVQNCEAAMATYFFDYKVEKFAPGVRYWTYFGSLAYTITLVTTIGYGNIYPVTTGGRIFTMVFAFFGIPLMLVVLNRLGKLCCHGIHRIWSLLRGVFCGHLIMKDKKLIDIAVEQQDFPVVFALAISFMWLFGCSGLFLIWEKHWDYFKSFYFTFISLSTVGLGDVNLSAPETLVISLVCIVVGLALVSMCINLVHLKIEAAFAVAMEKIRNKYAKCQRDDQEMSEPEPEPTTKMIDKLLKHQPEGRLIAMLLGHERKKALHRAWTGFAAMRLKVTQTEWTYQDSGSQYDLKDFEETSVKESTESGLGCAPEHPYREIIYRQPCQGNDLKRMFSEVRLLLDDCRGMLGSTDGNMSTEVATSRMMVHSASIATSALATVPDHLVPSASSCSTATSDSLCTVPSSLRPTES